MQSAAERKGVGVHRSDGGVSERSGMSLEEPGTKTPMEVVTHIGGSRL
jgi:hypothetical protein